MSGNILVGKGHSMPPWMRWCALLMGALLLSDGMRRLFSGAVEFSSFLPCILVGGACAYASGYEKTFSLSGEGFKREMLFWGKGRKEVLPWEDMEEIVLVPSQKGVTAIFPLKDGGWRAFFPGAREEDFHDLASAFRPGISVRRISE